MKNQGDPLARIADALDRLVPPSPVPADWLAHPAYLWDGVGRGVADIVAPPLDLLRAIEPQKHIVSENVTRFALGHAAHDMLLWGSRGMGKSALLRSCIATAQALHGPCIALVQAAPEALPMLGRLFAELACVERRFLVFLDDLGFEEGDSSAPRALRSWLEGGVEARPANVRLAVTSNRRAIVPRHASEQDDPINPRDAVDDRLALADRFGLSVGFHNCTQDDYLAILAGYCKAHGLTLDEHEALEWAKRRGSRSGRVAWQFVIELAGRAGKAL